MHSQDPTDNTVPVALAQTSVRSDGRPATVSQAGSSAEASRSKSCPRFPFRTEAAPSGQHLHASGRGSRPDGRRPRRHAAGPGRSELPQDRHHAFQAEDAAAYLTMLSSGQTLFPYPGLLAAPMENAAGGVFRVRYAPTFEAGAGVFTAGWITIAATTSPVARSSTTSPRKCTAERVLHQPDGQSSIGQHAGSARRCIDRRRCLQRPSSAPNFCRAIEVAQTLHRLRPRKSRAQLH